MEAETVRDSVLCVAGQLDTTLGGADLEYATGLTVPRFSLYFQHANEKQMTFLKLFDMASVNECYRRSESIVPQQASRSPISPLCSSRRGDSQQHCGKSRTQRLRELPMLSWGPRSSRYLRDRRCRRENTVAGISRTPGSEAGGQNATDRLRRGRRRRALSRRTIRPCAPVRISYTCS